MGWTDKATAEERQQMIDLFKAGEMPVKIAEKLGRSRHLVYKVLVEAGLHEKKKRTPMTDDERKQAIEMAQQKTSINAISKAIKRDRATVQLALTKAGIEPYWKTGRPKGAEGKGEKKRDVKQKHPFKPETTRTVSMYDGFISVGTGTHYYITKGYQGRYFLANDNTANHGIMSAGGYNSVKKARAALEYLKNLIEREGGACIDDVQN